MRPKRTNQHCESIPRKARKAGVTWGRKKKTIIPKRAYNGKTRHRPPATAAEKAHMDRVARLACDPCAQDGRLMRSNLHHVREGYGASQKASNWEVLPLCEPHHQGMRERPAGMPKVLAFHQSEPNFKVRYGNEIAMLVRTWEALGLDIMDLPRLRGSEPPWWQDFLAGKFNSTIDPEVRRVLTDRPDWEDA